MRSRSPAAVLACLLVAVSCSGDDDAGSTTTTEEATTTSEPSSTTTTAGETTTTTTASATCPDSSVPATATSVSSAGGDVDGDGLSDDPTVYLDGTAWHIHVTLSTGGAADVVIGEPSAAIGGGEVLGGVDINGDGNDEVWAKVGSGASAELFGLYDLAGCDLVPVSRGGEDAVFAVGASVLNVGGVRCDDLDGNGALDFVVELTASSTDGIDFDGLETELALDTGPPPTLTVIDQRPRSFAAADPESGDFARFQCGDLAR